MSLVPASAVESSLRRDPLSQDSAPKAESNHFQVRRSLAYRIRLPLTAVCMLIGVAFAVISRPAISPPTPFGGAVLLSGVLLVGAGIALRLWALACISERKTRELVTTGPYSLCRNPLYIGTLFIVTGFGAMWLNVFLAVMLLPPIVLYCFGVVPAEERVLRQTFGAEYDTYCRKTSRWIPSLATYVGGALSLRSIGVKQEAQSSLWWIGFAALSCWLTIQREDASWILF